MLMCDDYLHEINPLAVIDGGKIKNNYRPCDLISVSSDPPAVSGCLCAS